MDGPAYSLVDLATNVTAGLEERGRPAATAADYAGRNLVLAGLASLAVLAIGLAVWTLTGSGRSGLWAAAALTAFPAWTGHAMFNIKDTPAAVGFTLVTVALIIALVAEPPPPLRRARWGLVTVGLAIGVFLGFGTRLAFWVPLTAAVLAFLGLWLLSCFGRQPVWRSAPVAVAGGSLAAVVGGGPRLPGCGR